MVRIAWWWGWLLSMEIGSAKKISDYRRRHTAAACAFPQAQEVDKARGSSVRKGGRR